MSIKRAVAAAAAVAALPALCSAWQPPASSPLMRLQAAAQQLPRSCARRPPRRASVALAAQAENLEETVRVYIGESARARGSALPLVLPRASAGEPADTAPGDLCVDQELTNEQCEILDLPYGTKIVGEVRAQLEEPHACFHHPPGPLSSPCL